MVELSPQQFLGGPPQLGEILIAQGLIQRDQLFQALAHKDKEGLLLGQSLVALGFVTEEDLVRAFRSQQRFEAIHLTPDIIDPEVAAELSYDDCARYECIPVHRIAGKVTIAMSNPGDLLRIQELTSRMKSSLLPVFAEPRRIQEAQQVHFGRTLGEISDDDLPERVSELVREVCNTPLRPGGDADEPLLRDLVGGILEEAFSLAASALHIEPHARGVSVRLRVNGGLRERCALPGERAAGLVEALAHTAGLQDLDLETLCEAHAGVELRGRAVELDLSTAPSLHGPSAVVELTERLQAVEQLSCSGLTESQNEALLSAAKEHPGLILLAGPIRSGRTTLGHALLAELSHPGRKHISLESVEGRRLPGVLRLTQAGTRTSDLPARIHSALRMDPDGLAVGELRDRRTALAALQAADTGCLTLATIPASGAVDALALLVEQGLDAGLLAASTTAVVGQRLVPRLCTDCRVALDDDEHGPRGYARGEGCESCRGTGTTGRTGLFEVLVLSPTMKALLARGAGRADLLEQARDEGFSTLAEQSSRAVLEGKTSADEVARATGSTR